MLGIIQYYRFMRSFLEAITEDLFCFCDYMESTSLLVKESNSRIIRHDIWRLFLMGHCLLRHVSGRLNIKADKTEAIDFLSRSFLLDNLDLKLSDWKGDFFRMHFSCCSISHCCMDHRAMCFIYLFRKYFRNINTMVVTGDRVESVFDIVNVLHQ